MIYQSKHQNNEQNVQTPNRTGIPTQMKRNFEQRSGLSFNDVRVHYNSDRPRKLDALAYTYGNQVYIGPGQSRHLGHELGHVVQQKLGIPRPTGYIGGLPLNDSPQLERAADTGMWPAASGHGPNNLVQRIVNVTLKPSSEATSSGATSSGATSTRFLRPRVLKTGPQTYTASQLIVASFDLPYRWGTGLANLSTGRETQGDHTIADAFIKFYQKISVVHHTLQEAYRFYYTKFDKVIEENNLLPMEYTPSQLRSIDFTSPQEERLYQLQQGRVVSSTAYANDGKVACLNYMRDTTAEDVESHTKKFISVVEAYNQAYALSLLSSFGESGTGGHGERGATSEAYFSPRIQWEQVARLIDVDSVGRLAEFLTPYLQQANGQLTEEEIQIALSKELLDEVIEMAEQIHDCLASSSGGSVDPLVSTSSGPIAQTTPGVTTGLGSSSTQATTPDNFLTYNILLKGPLSERDGNPPMAKKQRSRLQYVWKGRQIAIEKWNNKYRKVKLKRAKKSVSTFPLYDPKGSADKSNYKRLALFMRETFGKFAVRPRNTRSASRKSHF